MKFFIYVKHAKILRGFFVSTFRLQEPWQVYPKSFLTWYIICTFRHSHTKTANWKSNRRLFGPFEYPSLANCCPSSDVFGWGVDPCCFGASLLYTNGGFNLENRCYKLLEHTDQSGLHVGWRSFIHGWFLYVKFKNEVIIVLEKFVELLFCRMWNL